MPAMLETRLSPDSFPSANLISPEGLSMTSVGALGFEGDVNA